MVELAVKILCIISKNNLYNDCSLTELAKTRKIKTAKRNYKVFEDICKKFLRELHTSPKSA